MLKQDNSSSGGVLSGYRVLDLTDEKGMFCSRLLADMGAQVVRVERPGADSIKNAFSRGVNLGKLDITLNIGVEPGQKVFKQLVKTADVVVESYQPGYLESLGLGYSDLSGVNPGLIMASITNFGQNGPYRDYQSDDMVASALGGQMYVCGKPQMPPLKPFGKQTYYSACLFAANGILLALWRRHTTNRGQRVDISLQECVAATLDYVLVRYFYEGIISKRQGGQYWNNAFCIFPCRDGYILLTLFQHWQVLVEWLASEGMAEDLIDKRWLGREERLRQLDHIIEVLERWTLSHTVAELVKKGQLMHFPWAEVASLPALVNNYQLRSRDFWVQVEHPETGKNCRFPGVLAKLSQSPWRVGSRVPKLGEHNLDIYPELGLSEIEIEMLTKESVI